MKIMLDTNVLISVFVFGGNGGKLLQRLIKSEHELYISDYVDQEFKAKLEQKWLGKAQRVYELFHTMNFKFCRSTDEKLGLLRDEKDIPVLSDALFHEVDLIITGDKDFLEADLSKPLVFSPAMFNEFLNKQEKDVQ